MLDLNNHIAKGRKLYVAMEDAVHMLDQMTTVDWNERNRVGQVALESLAGANGFTFVANEGIGEFISSAFTKIVEAIKAFFGWIKGFFVKAAAHVEEVKTEQQFQQAEVISLEGVKVGAVTLSPSFNEAFKEVEAMIAEVASQSSGEPTTPAEQKPSTMDKVKDGAAFGSGAVIGASGALGKIFKTKMGSVRLAMSKIVPKPPTPAYMASKLNADTVKKLTEDWGSPEAQTVNLEFFMQKYAFFGKMNIEMEKIIKANAEHHKQLKKSMDKVEHSTNPDDFEHFKKEQVDGVGSDAKRVRDTTIASLKALGFTDAKAVQWVKIPQDGGDDDEYYVSPILVSGKYMLAHTKRGTLVNIANRTADKNAFKEAQFLVLDPRELSRLNKARTGGAMVKKLKDLVDSSETSTQSLLGDYSKAFNTYKKRNKPADQAKAKLLVDLTKELLKEIQGLGSMVQTAFEIQQTLDRKILEYYRLCQLAWVVKE
jgi:hypothetical protein